MHGSSNRLYTYSHTHPLVEYEHSIRCGVSCQSFADVVAEPLSWGTLVLSLSSREAGTCGSAQYTPYWRHSKLLPVRLQSARIYAGSALISDGLVWEIIFRSLAAVCVYMWLLDVILGAAQRDVILMRQYCGKSWDSLQSVIGSTGCVLM